MNSTEIALLFEDLLGGSSLPDYPKEWIKTLATESARAPKRAVPLNAAEKRVCKLFHLFLTLPTKKVNVFLACGFQHSSLRASAFSLSTGSRICERAQNLWAYLCISIYAQLSITSSFIG